MNTKTESKREVIHDLNVESNISKVRAIDESELQLVTGGAIGTLGFNWVETVAPSGYAVTGASLFGSTYTQTQISGQ